MIIKKSIFILSIFTLIYSCSKKESDLLNIGQKFQGGIVAYLLKPEDPGYDANIKHGLICAISDQVIVPWYNVGNISGVASTGATGRTIGILSKV